MNAKQAAIRSGYSAKTAEIQGCMLLRNPKVAAAIVKGKQARSLTTGITQERVLNEVALLAFSSVEHYDVDENGKVTVSASAPDGAVRAIQSVKRKVRYDNEGNRTVEVELKLWDKPGPLKLAGRHVLTQGFFDKVEVTGKDGAPLLPDNPLKSMTTGEQAKWLFARIMSVPATPNEISQPEGPPKRDDDPAK